MGSDWPARYTQWTLTGMGGMSVEKQLGRKTAMALHTTSATASQIFCTYLIPGDYTDIFLNCTGTISSCQVFFCEYFFDNAENNAFQETVCPNAAKTTTMTTLITTIFNTKVRQMTT